MISNRSLRTLGVISALGLIVAFAGQSASADTFTWNAAATSTGWSTASNWLNVLVPTGTDTAYFQDFSYTSQPALTANSAIGGIWDVGSGGVAIANNTLTINGTTINGIPASGIVLDVNAGTLGVNSGVLLGGAQTWYNNSFNLLTVTGAINNNNKLLTISDSGYGVKLTGVISGSGGLTLNSGTLALTNAGNSFTGNIVVNGGTLGVYNGGNTTNWTLGSNLAGRLTTINSGGMVSFIPGNLLGGGTNIPGMDFVINEGGMLQNVPGQGSNNTLRNIYLNGGTLQTATGAGGNWQSFDLGGSMSVTGTATSYINGSSGARLGHRDKPRERLPSPVQGRPHGRERCRLGGCGPCRSGTLV